MNEAKKETKALLESKTVKFGVGVLVAAIVSMFVPPGWFESHPQVISVATTIIGFAVIVLRMVTGRPIDFGEVESPSNVSELSYKGPNGLKKPTTLPSPPPNSREPLIIKEGPVKKGGLNDPPTTTRPDPPSGQTPSD